jgi:hypothetical protein
MAYSYVCEGVVRIGEGGHALGGGDGGASSVIDTVIWFGPHASVTNVYLPVIASASAAPGAPDAFFFLCPRASVCVCWY